VGWALGAILFEINELPWILKSNPMDSHPFGFVFLASVIGFTLGVVASYFVYREIVEEKQPKKKSAEDSFEELRRLNTIELIRQRQNISTSSDLLQPMPVSTQHAPASELSENSSLHGNQWLHRVPGRTTNPNQYQSINDT
jgi:hypothetical protein